MIKFEWLAMIDDDYEDLAYEQARQRKVDADWMLAEDEAAKEQSFRQDQQLKELEMQNEFCRH